MSTKVILIRHGRTSWNQQKRYLGFSDIDLDQEGRRQARCLKKRLENEKISRVYSSDRKRALSSAKIVFKDTEIKKTKALREMHFGIFEGMTHETIMKKHAKIYSQWLTTPLSVKIPKGESLPSFKKRVLEGLKKIILTHDHDTVALLTHAGPIRVILNEILKFKSIWEFYPELTSIHIIEYDNTKTKILSLNDTSHLKDEGGKHG